LAAPPETGTTLTNRPVRVRPDLCSKRCEPHERDINLLWDVFLFDRPSVAMRRASAGPDGEWMAASRSPSLDHAGGVLVFSSRHPIDEKDVMNDDDLYIQMLTVAQQE